MYIHKKIDSRVIRTKAAIRSAYLQLLAQKDAAFITVTDIALQADVDRKTIYNYYESAVSILEELENELVNSILSSMKESDFSKFLHDPFSFLEAVTNAFNQHKDLSVPLIRKNPKTHLFGKLASAFSDRLTTVLSEKIQPQKQKYARLYADFMTNGIASVYQDWMLSGMKQPLAEIARQVSTLIDHGMESLT